MKSFKALIRQDIKGVFLNPEEFGEVHTINGKPFCVIVDENELIEREKKQLFKGMEGRSSRDGIYKKSLLFYVAGVSFGPMPFPDTVLTFDGKRYLVTDSNNEDGIYSISLEAARG